MKGSIAEAFHSLREILRPSDVTVIDEELVADSMASSGIVRLGVPTLCSLVPLDVSSCKRIAGFLLSGTELTSFAMSGFLVTDGRSWNHLMDGLAANSSIRSLEWNQIKTANIKPFPSTLSLPKAIEVLIIIDCHLPGPLRMVDLPGAIQELRVIGCGVQPEFFQSATHWRSFNTLELLDLRGNRLDRNCCVQIAELLSSSKVCKLILEDTQLTDDNLALLLHRLPTSLHALNVGQNRLTKGGELLELLRSHPSLTTLKADGNCISFPKLKTALNTIQRLDLCACHFTQCDRFQFLSSLPNLGSLDLSFNNLDDTILSGISCMKRLRVLKLSNCEIRDFLFSKLLENLSTMRCTVLDLENNRITSVLPLSQWMVGHGEHLETLRLAGNPIQDGILLWSTLELYCWKLKDLTGLFAAMRHWILLNRSGRSTFPDMDLPLVCDHLLRAKSVYGLDAIYYLIRHSPMVCAQHSFEATQQESLFGVCGNGGEMI